MAAEWWFPPSELGVRLVPCGHAILERDFPSDTDENGKRDLTCPVCEGLLPHSFPKVRDGVPKEDLTWGLAQCAVRRAFQDLVASEGIPASLEGLLVTMSTTRFQRLDLGSSTLRLGRSLREQGPTASLVLRAWPCGGTLAGGTLELPDSAVLLLTGHGARFQRTRFSGGVLVCCGAAFGASFTDCTFCGCTLYAVHGATVTLRGCSFTTSSAGVVAHGPATYATLHGCTFTAVFNAVIAERGATIITRHSSTRVWHASVVAHDPGTRVTSTDSDFAGAGHRKVPAVGVDVIDACVALRGCTVGDVADGVHADGRTAAVELRSCAVQASLRGVTALNHAAITLHDTAVQLTQAGAFLRAAAGEQPLIQVAVAAGETGNPGGRLQLERCSLRARGLRCGEVVAMAGGAVAMRWSDVANTGRCVTAWREGTVTLSHCTVRSEKEIGCNADGEGAVVRVVGGWLAGAEAAVQCTDGATATARGAALTGLPGKPVHGMPAVAVQDGSVARLSGCTVRHSFHGVKVECATCFAHGVEISGLFISRHGGGAIGYMQTAGRLTVNGGCVRGCVMGMTASVLPLRGKNRSTHARYEGVSFEANEMAMHVGGGSTVEAIDCEFTGGPGPWKAVTGRESWAATLGQTAVYVNDYGGATTITGCTFTKNQQDVQFYGKQGIEVSGCTFSGIGKGCSVSLNGRGTSVADCAFSAASCAVAVFARECAVTRCRVDASVRQGLAVEDGAETTVSACTIEAYGKGIGASDRATLAVADCECVGGKVGVSIDRGSAVEARRLRIQGGDVAVRVAAGDRDTATVRLEDCVLTGAAREGLVLADAGAEGTLEGCSVVECKVGVDVQPGAVAHVSKTQISKCVAGVVVGVPEDVVAHACKVCQRSGAAAVDAAWARLQADGGTGVPGARCMHDGAYARATLRDVEVRECGAGVQVHGTGRVDAERVEVRGAAAPFSVARIGARSRFAQCVSSGGGAPPVCARRLPPPGSGGVSEDEEIEGIVVEDQAACLEEDVAEEVVHGALG